MKRNRFTRIGYGVILIGLLLALLATGCASRRSIVPAEAPVPLALSPYQGEVVAEKRAIAVTGVGADSATAAAFATTERMVIRTASLDLIVPDTDKALNEIQAMAKELGGYVVSVEVYQYQEGRQASVTFRVPADTLDTALEQLRALATTVRRESVSGQDVTEEYVDLESRLRHLEAKEKQLLEFLEKAEDTEAVLAVYEHLSQTQAEIEQVKGRMRFLRDRVALATITVSLIPDALAQPLDTGGWNLPATFRNAVETLLSVLEFVVEALIYFVIVVLPSLILLALPMVGIALLVRYLVRRRRR